MHILQIFSALLTLAWVSLNVAVVFTNIKCTSLDKNFGDFEYCFLRSVNRSYKYLSVRANVYKKPLNNVTVNYAFLKRANGYKPFLYNKTVNVCRYLKSRKNILLNYFHKFFEDYSNMNHTCPYNHDLIMEKVPTAHVDKMLAMLPMPDGDYMFHTNWMVHGVLRANVKIYLTHYG